MLNIRLEVLAIIVLSSAVLLSACATESVDDLKPEMRAEDVRFFLPMSGSSVSKQPGDVSPEVSLSARAQVSERIALVETWQEAEQAAESIRSAPEGAVAELDEDIRAQLVAQAMLRYWMDEPRGTPMQESAEGRSLIRTYVLQLSRQDSPEAIPALSAMRTLGEAETDEELMAAAQRIGTRALEVVSEQRSCEECAEAVMRGNQAVGEAFEAHLVATEAAANELLHMADV